MKTKSKKILSVIFNVLVAIILIFAVFITLNVAFSARKGYASLFGYSYVSVQSSSMSGEKPAGYETKPDGFNKGDLIKIKLLSGEEKSGLSQGDVITYFMAIGGERKLNTHRIISVGTGADGRTVYTTKGDSYLVGDNVEAVYDTDVVGLYTGKKYAGVGKITDFLHSSEGFFVCVVLPSFAIVAYYGVNLFLTVKNSGHRKNKAVLSSEEIEKIKLELMRELLEDEENRKRTDKEEKEKG